MPGQFFLDLRAVVIEQPPVILGLAPIGIAPVGCQANHLASGRVHRAHAILSGAGSPFGCGDRSDFLECFAQFLGDLVVVLAGQCVAGDDRQGHRPVD